MNVVKEIERITELELQHGIYGGSTASWHHKYRESAWVYVGGLTYELTEGDVICVMSQWGEIEDINLVREKGTNKSMGFAFVKYEDQRSTILAVDNFNGIKLLGRTLRVDHVDKYKLPKDVREREEEQLGDNPSMEVSIGPGHAYKAKPLANEFNISAGIDLWASQEKSRGGGRGLDSGEEESSRRSSKKHKKDRHKKHKKSDRRRRSEEDESVLPLDDVMESGHSGAVSSVAAAEAGSWRGRMDPLANEEADRNSRRQKEAEGGGGGTKRGEFEGFGGMKRRR